MENSLFKRIIPLAFILMASNVIAQNSVIYRWVDQNNVVHFSQHQPQHDNYTTIQMAKNNQQSNSAAKNVPQPNENATTKAIESINEADEKTAIENTMEKRCQEARANIRTLMAFDNVQYIDAEGQAKVLSETEKNQQLALSEKQVEVYCKK
ncbi:DUF4124 domain-containing protein [Thalassotalea agariperforans]